MDEEHPFSNFILAESEIDSAALDFNFAKPVHFDYDPLHDILVLANKEKYVVYIGEKSAKDLRNQGDQTAQSSRRTLSLLKSKVSLLDNTIEAVLIKNMRLYLLDKEYSMNVFNMTVQV